MARGVDVFAYIHFAGYFLFQKKSTKITINHIIRVNSNYL
jgi:hypothetical protein